MDLEGFVVARSRPLLFDVQPARHGGSKLATAPVAGGLAASYRIGATLAKT